MKLQLPTFDETTCVGFFACASVDTKVERKLSKALPPRKPLVVAYRRRGEKIYLRLLPRDGGHRDHLHIDCATARLFEKRGRPTVTGKVLDLSQSLTPVDSLVVDVRVGALFLVTPSEVPERGLIRGLMAPYGKGDVQLKLTGATLKVEGAPVRRLEWSLDTTEKQISVYIEAVVKETINEGYLVRCMERIKEQFSIFVVQERSDGSA